jgi:ATP-binding cassette subfamily B protein
MLGSGSFNNSKRSFNGLRTDSLRLLNYLKPYKGRVVLAVSLMILVSLLQLIGPYLTAYAVDHYLLPGAGKPAALGSFSQVIGLYFVVSFVTALFLFWQTWLTQHMGQRVMLDLRQSLYHHVVGLDQNYFHRHPVGRIMTRVTSDVDALNELFVSGFVSFFGDVILLFGIAAVMLLFNWKLALVTFSILPLLFLLSLWFQRNALKSYRLVRKRIASVNSFLQEYLSGILAVQLFQQERNTLSAFTKKNADLRDANIRSIFYYAFFYPGIELLSSSGVALIIWYGGGEVVRGTITPGVLLAFIQYVRRFYEPLNDLAEKYNIYQSAVAASERIFELLDTRTAIPDTGRESLEDRTFAITLENVSFAYRENEWVLNDLSIHIPAGEKAAIVGHTGAGKSTLIALIKRFYDPQAGAVKLDGKPLQAFPVRELRMAIAEVPQEVTVFTGSVLDNMRLFEDAISEEEVKTLLRELEFLEWFENLPQGLETPLGQQGAELSLGQRQVVNIIRSMVRKPKLLILDEATASIDSILESKIQRAVEKLMKGRTTIIVAHRLATVHKADRILVLHKGRLVEEGTHQELLRKDGTYKKLYRLFQAS